MPARDALNVEYTTTKQIVLDAADLKSRNVVAGFAHDPKSEPYRSLRSQVLKIMRANGWRTLAITSPTVGNGKTLTAVNLAISLSQEVNQTVLLVDLDLRAPAVASTLGIRDIDIGISDCIQNGVPLGDILINPGFNRLVVAPGTSQGFQTSEILSSPKMLNLKAELLGKYEDRLLLFDLPALLTSDDALVFTSEVDSVLLVLEDGVTKKKELQHAMKLLEGVNVIGAVINKVRF